MQKMGLANGARVLCPVPLVTGGLHEPPVVPRFLDALQVLYPLDPSFSLDDGFAICRPLCAIPGYATLFCVCAFLKHVIPELTSGRISPNSHRMGISYYCYYIVIMLSDTYRRRSLLNLENTGSGFGCFTAEVLAAADHS